MHEFVNNLLGPYLMGLLIATAIGFIIGLEREFDAAMGNEHFAGLRTFSLTSILGYTITVLAKQFLPITLAIALPGFCIFITVFHFIKSQKDNANLGILTEISLLITFALGVLSALHFIKEALATSVITVSILSLKQQFKSLITRITQDELYAFIKFIVLSLLILPFLPDTGYGPNGIINPRSIGFVVVLTSLLSFIGYLLIKFGSVNRGILLTGLIGGTFSSTAVTWIFSTKSKENSTLSATYAGGIILACSVMFLRVLLLTYLFNPAIFSILVLPCLLMSFSGVVWVYIIYRKNKVSVSAPAIQLGNPVDIKNALFFGLLFAAIGLMIFYANKFWGNNGLYLSGMLSGITDVDAISINMANFAKRGGSLQLAVIVIVIAMLSNTIVKMLIATTKGTREERKWILYGLGTMIITGALYIFSKGYFLNNIN
ncbi:MAG: MgtC/SapB family protein [Chitinophagales bacterium]|nr:MgtC/SapB family protein [Chitinophagales bacterium]